MSAAHPTRLSIVVAAARNGVIGRGNELPWQQPADLKHFKQVTMGKPILMGRRTFESIGRPLPGRRNLVLTRDPAFAAEGVERVSSLDDACTRIGSGDLMVIGGAQIYAQALERCDQVFLTRIDADVPGDTRFEDLPTRDWELVEDDPYPADERNALPMRFQRWVRRRPDTA